MSGKKIKILVVDDDSMLLDNMCALLQHKGFDVQSASSGASAFEMWKNKPFDLVISDVDMTEGNGTWLAKTIKNTNPLMPVILMSGGNITSEEALSAGAAILLQKPFKMETLFEAIHASVDMVD